MVNYCKLKKIYLFRHGETNWNVKNVIQCTKDTELNENGIKQAEKNAEKLKELTGSVAWTLNNDDESILNTLSQLKMNLSKASRMDSGLEDSESELINIIESIKDLIN